MPKKLRWLRSPTGPDGKPWKNWRLSRNPSRKALDKELRLARAAFTKLQERFGAMAIDYVDGHTPQSDFEKTEEKLRSDMEKTTTRIQKLKTRRDSLPTHLPLAEAKKGQEVVKFSTERRQKVRRHLMRARSRKGFGWTRWSSEWLYDRLGLFNNYQLRRW